MESPSKNKDFYLDTDVGDKLEDDHDDTEAISEKDENEEDSMVTTPMLNGKTQSEVPGKILYQMGDVEVEVVSV